MLAVRFRRWWRSVKHFLWKDGWAGRGDSGCQTLFHLMTSSCQTCPPLDDWYAFRVSYCTSSLRGFLFFSRFINIFTTCCWRIRKFFERLRALKNIRGMIQRKVTSPSTFPRSISRAEVNFQLSQRNRAFYTYSNFIINFNQILLSFVLSVSSSSLKFKRIKHTCMYMCVYVYIKYSFLLLINKLLIAF